jgi:hypothetical protein
MFASSFLDLLGGSSWNKKEILKMKILHKLEILLFWGLSKFYIGFFFKDYS